MQNKYNEVREVDEKIKEALYKKSLGYDLTEVVEEYNAEGDMVKRKVSTKYIPPDTSALKMYLEEGNKEVPIVSMSDEELMREKIRLLNLLKELEPNENS